MPQRRFAAGVCTFLSALVTVILFSMPLSAKDYTNNGKVVGKGQNEHSSTMVSGAGGNVSGHSRTMYSHTYKIETADRLYEMDCTKHTMFKTVECGDGTNGMQIGDVVHFRLEKGSAFLKLANGKEDRLIVLSEEAKPESSTATKPEAK